MQTTEASPMTRSEKKHADILAAASAEFREKGFGGASMDSISARANVSKRTLYNHFSSKDTLFEAITLSLWQACKGVPFLKNQPLETQLTTMAQEKLTMLADQEHIELARCVLAEYMKFPAMAHAAMEKFNESEDGVQRWFHDALANGALQGESAEFITHQFFGLLKTFAFLPQLMGHLPAPTPAEQKRIIDSAVSMILKQYQHK